MRLQTWGLRAEGTATMQGMSKAATRTKTQAKKSAGGAGPLSYGQALARVEAWAAARACPSRAGPRTRWAACAGCAPGGRLVPADACGPG